jgi:hypothetical protein
MSGSRVRIDERENLPHRLLQQSCRQMADAPFRTRQSRLLIWSASIAPSMPRPSGNSTSKRYPFT